MQRYVAKIICGILMYVTVPICFLLPVKLVDIVIKHGERGQLFLDLLTCFAGGVFLSTYLVFMAPAVRVLIEENLMKPNGITYPLPDMLIGLGFFLMLALDKLVHYVDSKTRERSEIVDGHPGHRGHPGQASDGQLSHCRFRIDSVHSDDHRNGLQSGAPSTGNGLTTGSHMQRHSINSATGYQSHVEMADCGEKSTLRSIVLMLAISIDSVLEGVTIGLKSSVAGVWTIFIGIIVHEAVLAFCVGLQLVRVNSKSLRPVILACVVYTLMTPLGVLIATAVYETMEANRGMEIASGVLQAAASGCFIYIIFCEILEGQISHNTPLSKIIVALVGYGFLSAFGTLHDPSMHGPGEESSCSSCCPTNLSQSH